MKINDSNNLGYIILRPVTVINFKMVILWNKWGLVNWKVNCENFDILYLIKSWLLSSN